MSSCLSFGSDLTLHGLDQLPLSSVGAVVFGFTTKLTYSDITFASLLLNNPNVLFLLEAPDATLRTRTSGDAFVEIPCKAYELGICMDGENGDQYKRESWQLDSWHPPDATIYLVKKAIWNGIILRS